MELGLFSFPIIYTESILGDRPPAKAWGTSAKLSESICGFQKRTGRFNGDANNPVEQDNRSDDS